MNYCVHQKDRVSVFVWCEIFTLQRNDDPIEKLRRNKLKTDDFLKLKLSSKKERNFMTCRSHFRLTNICWEWERYCKCMSTFMWCDMWFFSSISHQLVVFLINSNHHDDDYCGNAIVIRKQFSIFHTEGFHHKSLNSHTHFMLNFVTHI